MGFKGGEGSIPGLLVGFVIIGVINNGLQLFALSDFYQVIVKGSVLLIAVGFDAYRKARREVETVAKVAG